MEINIPWILNNFRPYEYFNMKIGARSLVPYCACFAQACMTKESLPTATVDRGVVIGTTTTIAEATVKVNQYLGIPFASAPIGTGRFSPPKPTSWVGSLQTKEFKPSCIQVFNPYDSRDFIQDVFSVPRPEESEDCLYLNVFAPRDANSKNKTEGKQPLLPVLFWIYGGGYKFGNAGQPIYSGAPMAALEDVIVVSINYRTNLFGFPISPSITNITERNLGLLDQRAALDWVQRNIEAFGGDPSSVTIFGQSAGAFAVDVHLTSIWPNEEAPFRAAIMQSGTYSYNPVAPCNNTDYKDDLRYAQEQYNINFGMGGDNYTIVCDPRVRREAGRFVQVPVIGGSTVDDGSYYAAKNGTDIDKYFSTVFANETALKESVLAAYDLNPAEGRVDNQTILAQIHTDWNFHCPAMFLSNSSTQYVPTYRYIFNATFPNQRLAHLPDNRWPVSAQKAYHSSEIPIVLSTYNRTNATMAQVALSNTMRKAWARFAKDPWEAPIPGWKVAGRNGSFVMDFGTNGGSSIGVRRDETGKCWVWKDFIWKKHQ
ncbi:unnamed protein product [Periconia digitata]|uniref:Carboxylic ester hydrolase n=1 Tax=Periconia digitata TaxID=1303443 RepID=A0A9W4UCV3_9PLEO|nr:unnamed protein product [Periconia digitata]